MNIIKNTSILKNFLARSNGYLLVATFGLSLYNVVPSKFFIPLFILGITFMLTLGYLDYKLGFFREEQLHVSKQNPILLEILKEVKK